MKKILVVERDDFTTLMIQESLSDLGYYAFTCDNQELSVNLINIDPDIVLINLTLYIKNKQLFYNGRERLTNSRVVLTSSLIRDPIHFKEIGADSFVLKPFDVDTLKNVIERCSQPLE